MRSSGVGGAGVAGGSGVKSARVSAVSVGCSGSGVWVATTSTKSAPGGPSLDGPAALQKIVWRPRLQVAVSKVTNASSSALSKLPSLGTKGLPVALPHGGASSHAVAPVMTILLVAAAGCSAAGALGAAKTTVNVSVSPGTTRVGVRLALIAAGPCAHW